MSQFHRANAVGRLLRVPGLIVFAVLLHLLPQLIAGSRAARFMEAALGRYALPEGRSLLSGLAEMFTDHPTLGPAQGSFTLFATLGTLLLWWLVLAGVLRHLDEPGSGSEVLARGWKGLPRILVVSLWHWPVRLVLVGVPIALGQEVLEGPAATASLVVGLLFFFYCTCALDLARCQAVLHRSKPFHPRVAWSGFVQAARRPGVLIPSLLLGLAQWAVALSVLYVGVGNLDDPGTAWTIRGLAALAVVLGLSRLSVAVGAGPPGRRIIESRLPSE